MNMMKCPACNTPLKRNGKTSSGSQRWRCKECGGSKVGKIDNSAKELNHFLVALPTRADSRRHSRRNPKNNIQDTQFVLRPAYSSSLASVRSVKSSSDIALVNSRQW
ncbi:transposase-like zinc-binding domain-containing protein [Mobiluncus porci]|uniref:transposase-like zinc-binding domain-containing protein n=1 Tax=Mobiluncus porci TaxID=2652278 RepID=UPI003B849EFA